MKRTILKCSASWCGPCKMLKPIFEKLKTELETDSVIFDSVSDDEDEDRFDEVTTKYGVRSLPTTLILDENDEVIDKMIGFGKEDVYKNFIMDNIK